jgi:nitroreductase
MAMDFPVEQTVRNRYSVRTYNDQVIPPELWTKLEAYISTLSNPFGAQVTFRILQSAAAEKNRKLGTYGMIKGAKEYLGAIVSDSPLSLESLGYEFESLILYSASLGLGTCWLGGTFTRSEFEKAMDSKEGDIFPAISPIGYAADRKSLTEVLSRKYIKADQRKPWDSLFFFNSFTSPLSPEEAGEYSFPLEMVRLAPSASNKQPWRIVKCGDNYHFYEAKTPGYSSVHGYDMQRIDMGIAACHFYIAAKDKNLPGECKILTPPALELPENTAYCFSYEPHAGLL